MDGEMTHREVTVKLLFADPGITVRQVVSDIHDVLNDADHPLRYAYVACSLVQSGTLTDQDAAEELGTYD